MGVATEGDLRDYFRMRPADTPPRLAELVEAGEPGSSRAGFRGLALHPAYVYRDAAWRRPRARALLSPFGTT